VVASQSKLAAAFSGKTVLVTGHTGFKGSWLSAWLRRLGANVVGLSIDIPTEPSHFKLLNIAGEIEDIRHDVRDADAVGAAMARVQPDFVFHLAAQPLVRRAYNQPLETFSVNAIGTAVVLDSLRTLKKPCAAVIITSDKCYDNVEWEWGYRETDLLGGKDPYSGSKGAAELVIRSYHASYFSAADHPVRLAVGRAGNVVGGGDWAEDRLVPDCVRAWANGAVVDIRSPNATRPWQHVLEPLSGYLWLAALLSQDRALNGEAFNFGPAATDNYTVEDVITAMAQTWSSGKAQFVVREQTGRSEAGLLKLNCDKAFARLAWRPTLTFVETARMTSEWYDAFYANAGGTAVRTHTTAQIATYETLAKGRGLAWAN